MIVFVLCSIFAHPHIYHHLAFFRPETHPDQERPGLRIMSYMLGMQGVGEISGDEALSWQLFPGNKPAQICYAFGGNNIEHRT